MGPGRWGSRGDIKLGVSVTYADINNTAVLLEIARRKGDYVPDLSFGTHFFQDLVEAGIRYLPLYPDDKDIAFQENWLVASPNLLADLAPEFADLAGCLKVIDVPAVSGGRVLRIFMNADLDEAMAVLRAARRQPARGDARSRSLPARTHAVLALAVPHGRAHGPGPGPPGPGGGGGLPARRR